MEAPEESIFKVLVKSAKLQSLNELTSVGKRFFISTFHLFLKEEGKHENRKSYKTFEILQKNPNIEISKAYCLSILSELIDHGNFLPSVKFKEMEDWITPKKKISPKGLTVDNTSMNPKYSILM